MPGAALNDLNVPVFAVAVSAARNVHAWWKGSLSLQDLPFEVAVDGAVKGGLTAAGGFAGQSIGLLLFGPAGAVVFGALGGTGALFGSGWVRERFDKVLVAEWVRGLDEPDRGIPPGVESRHAQGSSTSSATSSGASTPSTGT